MRLCSCLAAILILGIPAIHAAAPIRVILDTDIGDDIDDALALALALQSPELKVEAVVTVLQDGDRRADLVWRILELYGRTEIPVGVGAESPLLAKPRSGEVRQTQALASGYHMPRARRNGIELMLSTCMQSTEKITLLAYGPLTNVALALRAEPRLVSKISRIVLMNGVFFRPGLEYNTKMDPEASQIVYNSGIPIITVGLDVTLQCRLSAEDLQKIASSPLPAVKFLYGLIRIWQNGNETQRPVLHDPLSVLVAIRPDLIGTVQGRVTVETRGTPDETYGLTTFHKDAGGPVQVAQEVGSSAAIALFLERILASPRKL